MKMRSASLILLTPGLLAACLTRSPVGTEYVGPEYRVLETSALYGDEPSAITDWILQLLEAKEEFRKNPEDVLDYVHGLVVQQPRRNTVFVLSELAYLAGKRTGNRDLFLLSAIAAFTYLEGDEQIWGEYPSPYDRAFRWACDFYNRSISRAFSGEERGTLSLTGGIREFPGGSLEIEIDLSAFPFEHRGLRLLVADQRKLRGLEYRMRDSGLGTPLIAVVREGVEATNAAMEELDKTTVSATAFLRLDGDLRRTRDGLHATLELHSTYDCKEIEVGGRRLPLETDQSATIAYGTELAGFWRHDISGFFRGANARHLNGLILPRPYERGRIPIVLVHGTASSPTYWADVLNALNTDAVIRPRFQFWLFVYSTGNPIAYSASTLRKKLDALVDKVDPEGTDDALRRMILIGHSQGGLLIKMLGAKFDADEVVRSYTGKSLSTLGLEESDEELLRGMFDVDPSPYVERLVYIATPHRGSFLAQYWFARTLAKMIAVPGELLQTAENLRKKLPPDELPKSLKSRVSTSLDNMNPNSPFLKLLLGTEISSEIHQHSIIAIGKSDSPEGADDGVVAYRSAHIDDVDSEILVPSGHSCQSHPRTLLELRRILRLHLGIESEIPDPRWRRRGGNGTSGIQGS